MRDADISYFTGNTHCGIILLSPEFLLTNTPWSEIRFHCPRLCSFLSCKRAVLQVTGLCAGPPTQAQGTVRVPAWQISSSAATWQCLFCTEGLRREDMDTEFAKHTSFLIPCFPTADFSVLLSTPSFWCVAKRFRSEWLCRTSEKYSLIVYSLLWKIKTECHKTKTTKKKE